VAYDAHSWSDMNGSAALDVGSRAQEAAEKLCEAARSEGA